MDRIPAPALFMAAGFSQFFGAAIAVGLFAFAPPHTVAWMRSVVAGVIIVALIRPWRTTWTKKTLTESGLFGLLLLGMNMFVYIAINYLPLGAAITLEFVGPILVAVWRGQGVSSRIAAILAMVGV